MELVSIGTVESPLTDPAAAPKQGGEGAPDAWLAIDPRFATALADVEPCDELVVLTWLDRADRSIQRVHPRDDPQRPQQGVFSTRSADRPNPIGLHEVTVRAREGTRLHVGPLEAIDGTPVVDLKPVLR